MRRAFNNPVGRGFRLAALAAEPASSLSTALSPIGDGLRPGFDIPTGSSAERGAPARLLLGLVLLPATLVLGVEPAVGQTLTISPTGSVNVTEGDTATAFSATVSDVPQDSTAQFGIVEIKKAGGVTSGDFKLYDSDPSMGSPTALTLLDAPTASLPNLYYVQWSGITNIPTTKTTYNYWIEVPDDSVLIEGVESIELTFAIFDNSGSGVPTARSQALTLNVTDAPLPDPTGKPTMPANLTATAGKGAVTLTWDGVDATSSNTNLVNDLQITKHQYRQSTDGGTNYGTWTDIPNSAYGEINANSYTIESLTAGTDYTFQVRAVNGCSTTTGCGESDPATAVMATPDADARARPTGLTASAGNAEVTLTWTDPGDATITFYEYQQKAGSAAFGDWTVIPGSSATTTSYRLTGLDNGRAYVYRIRAGRGTDISLASDPVTVTPRSAPPAAPQLTATPRHGGVTLSWPNPFDPNIERWEYRYKVGAGVYELWRTARVATVSECSVNTTHVCGPPYFDTRAATLQFAVDGLTNGTPHTFHIQAVNADGATTSNEASATPVAGVPAKPTGLTAGRREGGGAGDYRALTWDRVEDPSILRYEFTVDEGRTWSFLALHLIGNVLTRSGSTNYVLLEPGEYLSSHTFRVRAVNALGPGPASEPSVVHEDAEPVAIARPASNVAVEWDSTTKKATLVWDPTEHDDVRGWSLYFSRTINGNQADDWNTFLPVGTTRYEIPATFNGGNRIAVQIGGCLSSLNCGREGGSYYTFRVGIPRWAPSGFPPPRATGRSRLPGTTRWTAALPISSMRWVRRCMAVPPRITTTFPTATTRTPAERTKPATPSRRSTTRLASRAARTWSTGKSTCSSCAPRATTGPGHGPRKSTLCRWRQGYRPRRPGS